MFAGANYIELKAKYPWQNSFMVVDTANEIGLRMVDDIHISAKYQVFAKSDSKYKCVIFKFNKKHRQVFLKTIAQIPNKALICGYSDYKVYCNKLIKDLLKKEGRGEI